jgi:pSer/pThr/pTyr-binding forkhead associated (FHA) protein
MDVKLIVANGKHIGEKLPVSGPKFIIGRSEECQLRLGSDLISRHHCAIMIEDGYVAIRDFGSKNGTFVNGERVRSEQELKNGDRLTVGQVEFLVELVVNVSGKKKPKVHSVQEAAARTVESGADELDLAGWLAEGETVVGSSAQTETQPLPAPSVSPDAAASTAPPSEQEEAKPAKPASDTPTRPTFGKKAVAADSREAAANVLKAFFNRR